MKMKTYIFKYENENMYIKIWTHVYLKWFQQYRIFFSLQNGIN